MNSFDPKKNIKDSIKDGLIIAGTTTGIYFEVKSENRRPQKVSLDTMDIMKLARGLCGGVLVKVYAVYEEWVNVLTVIQKCYDPKGYKTAI